MAQSLDAGGKLVSLGRGDVGRCRGMRDPGWKGPVPRGVHACGEGACVCRGFPVRASSQALPRGAGCNTGRWHVRTVVVLPWLPCPLPACCSRNGSDSQLFEMIALLGGKWMRCLGASCRTQFELRLGHRYLLILWEAKTSAVSVT